VKDCIEGEDLHSRTARQPPKVNEVVDRPDAVRDALAYLHSRQPPVIHRDIEPSSLRLQPDGTIVLVDFGIARVSDRQQASAGARGLTPGPSGCPSMHHPRWECPSTVPGRRQTPHSYHP